MWIVLRLSSPHVLTHRHTYAQARTHTHTHTVHHFLFGTIQILSEVRGFSAQASAPSTKVFQLAPCLCLHFESGCLIFEIESFPQHLTLSMWVPWWARLRKSANRYIFSNKHHRHTHTAKHARHFRREL